MRKVLVVEDNDLLRENICEILKLDGHEVIHAIHGQDGWNKIKESQPDLVLSDVNMPVMDGFELLKIIREHEQLHSLPFIFLTVRNTMRELRLGMNYGADDYLAKPFEIHHLLTVVQNRLKRIKNQKEEASSPEIRKEVALSKAYDVAIRKEVVEPIDEIIKELTSEASIANAKSLKSNAQKIVHSLQIDTIQKCQRQQQKILESEENIEISELISNVISNHMVQQSIPFDIHIAPYYVQAPLNYLSMAFTEILENAVKFSDGSSQVKITGAALSQKEYQINITNTGLAFDHTNQTEIGPFKTFIDNDSYEAGIGLGLHNASRILNFSKTKFKLYSKAKNETIFSIYFTKG